MEDMMKDQVDQLVDYIMKWCLWQFKSREWDRKNQNKEIRYYLPKGTDLSGVTKERLKRIEREVEIWRAAQGANGNSRCSQKIKGLTPRASRPNRKRFCQSGLLETTPIVFAGLIAIGKIGERVEQIFMATTPPAKQIERHCD